MADNVTLDAGAGGAIIKTDDDGVAHWQYVKNAFGADNTQTRVTPTEGLPVQNDDTSLAVEGEAAEDAAVSGNPVLVGGRYDAGPRTLDDGDVGALALDADGAVHVADGGNTLTVDGTVAVSAVPAPLNVVGGGTEAAAQRVTIANDSTGLVSVDDGGGTLSVDGTVAVTTIIPGVAATNLGKAEDTAHANGDVGVMSLGVRTDARATIGGADGDYVPPQMTVNGDMRVKDDDANTLLGTIDTDTGVIAGDTTSIDGKITACNTGAVTISAALPAGANAIGKLAANTGIDIGDVDVTSVVPGSAAANLGKAEDAVHGSGDVGVMALGVREDAANGALGADGDYVPLTTDADGLLRVLPGVKGPVTHAVVSHIVNGNNTLVVAAGAGNKIRVLSMLLVAHGDVTVTIEDGAAGADLSGPYEFDGAAQPKGVCLSFNPVGHFVTSANTLLNMVLDAAVRVAGHIVYDVVT